MQEAKDEKKYIHVLTDNAEEYMPRVEVYKAKCDDVIMREGDRTPQKSADFSGMVLARGWLFRVAMVAKAPICCEMECCKDFTVGVLRISYDCQNIRFCIDNSLMLLYAFRTAPLMTLEMHAAVVVRGSLEDARGASYRTPSGLQDASLQDALTGYSLEDIPQIAYLTKNTSTPSYSTSTPLYTTLHSHEEAVKSKRVHAENFRLIETESNKINAATIIQPVGNQYVVVNPPYPTMTTEELDAIYDLPFQYHPHPKYKGKHIPAYEMIRFSVCMHRGCFGACSFCTISAHQGKQITSRSEHSILRQINLLKDLPDWKGYLSDLGGPSANMYGMHGKDMNLCEKCARPSCLYPTICKNLNQDFAPLLHIYKQVNQLPYIKKAFVGSGIRYDLMSEEYGKQLITNHVSGRLKVAPEHTSSDVLKLMRKPAWEEYEKFHRFFEKINREAGLR